MPRYENIVSASEAFKRLNPQLFPTLATSEGTDNEGALHVDIMAWLKSKGIRCVIHSRMDRPTTNQVGVPDLLFVYSGKPYALEAKAKGRKLTPEQVGWLAAMRLDGWTTGVVRSLEDVKTLMGL